MAFKTFETEEEYEAAFADRIARERKKYADYDAIKEKAGLYDELVKADYEGKAAKAKADYDKLVEKYKDYDKNVADLTERAARAENSLVKIRIANEYKLPMDLAERITGADEKAMKEDAEKLSKYLHAPAAPGFSAEPRIVGNPKDAAREAALKSLLHNLDNKKG